MAEAFFRQTELGLLLVGCAYVSELVGALRVKLLFVVTEDWYFVSHRLQLAVTAKQVGFDVSVATRIGKHERTLRKAGIRVIPLSLSRRSGNPVREITALIRLYRTERPDFVHHVALKPVVYGSLAAQLVGVPAWVNAVAGLGWLFTASTQRARIIRPWLQWGMGRLLSHSHSLTIVQNPDDAALLEHSGIPGSRLRLIRGAGVDVNRFRPVDLSCRSVPVVMLVARMLWDKGVGEFVEAAKLLHNQGVRARFVLVGAPDPANPASVPEAVLRGWHEKNGVEWWGQRMDMAGTYRQAQIACLPSYYREGIPKSLLEAAACGLPIVTTDAPGCREVVHHEDNGLLVPVKDPDALARALHRLIVDEELRHRMGARGRQRAETEFSQEQIHEQTLAVYRELLS